MIGTQVGGGAALSSVIERRHYADSPIGKCGAFTQVGGSISGGLRYFTCLIDGACAVDERTGRRAPRFRVEMPGHPILGDGKADNQNGAIPFTRGTILQMIDANQESESSLSPPPPRAYG